MLPPGPEVPIANRYTRLPERGANVSDPVEAMAGAALHCLTALYNPAGIDNNFPKCTVNALQAALARIKELHEQGYQPPPPLTPRDADLNTVRKLEPGATLSKRVVHQPSFDYGSAVAERILQRLAVRDTEPGAGDVNPPQGGQVYTLGTQTRFVFRDEPSNPISRRPVNKTDDPGTTPLNKTEAVRIYHAPFYGETAVRFSVTQNHVLADPPRDTVRAQRDEYDAAVREVYHHGGAPHLNSTTRTPDQTIAAWYWAYDGANLIGTPPRLYNQVLRRVAHLQRDRVARTSIEYTDEYVRLFALANVAMADAGTLAWAEKYHHNFWRPLGGVREDDAGTGPQDSAPYLAGIVNGEEHLINTADPFWLALGAPATNTNGVPFKPPFPAYPSGHATFGAAAFQMARLFYKDRHSADYRAGGRVRDETPDDLSFDFVSDELDGISRDLYQKHEPTLPIEGQQGLVRTRVVRRFESLWAAIYENAASRVYLGVHWRFDSFAAKDVVGTRLGRDKIPLHKSPENIRYASNGSRAAGGNPVGIGGVPLGLAIANDIFKNQMQQSPNSIQPAIFSTPVTPVASKAGSKKSAAASAAPAAATLLCTNSGIRPG